MTFRDLTPTVVVGATGMILVTLLLGHHYGDFRLFDIAGIIVLTSGTRVAVVARFNSKPRPELTLAEANRWQAAYGLMTVLQSLMLAISTAYNFAQHDQTAHALCSMGAFMLCAGMSARFGLSPWVLQFAGVLVLGTLGVCVFQSPERLVARAGAALVFCFALTYWQAVQSKYDLVMGQMRLKRQMRDLAEQDALTGLANRRRFLDRVSITCEQGEPFAILYIDLDRFKKVNDTHGHQTGDALLQHVAERLRGTLRQPDLLARLGGDEFAILHAAPATQATAEALASRINQTISTPFAIDGKELAIGASVGIRLSDGDSDAKRLMRMADEALYQVKQAGGSSFRFASADEMLLAH